MISGIFSQLGPWNWMVLGFILLALEIVIPGVFLLWIGVGAILTGAVSLQLWGWPFWVWQVQVLLFLVLAVGSVFVGRRIMQAQEAGSDQPLLNKRAEQLVGRTAMLSEPIREGQGRIKLGDTLWMVSGPDLPAGAHVRVVAARDSELVVEETVK